MTAAFMGHHANRVARTVLRSAPSGIWQSLRRPPAVGLLALLLAACGGAATPTTHTLGGTISLGSNTVNDGVPVATFTHKDSTDTACRATGGYDDIREGAPVTVKDQAGVVIATGSLGPGQYLKPKVCTFAFAVVVPEAEFYSVEVSHRGALNYSRADLEARGWRVSLTLG